PNPSDVTATTPISVSSVLSQHVLVPTSALGPPSPTSSSASSPQISNFNISEVSQTYPTIDELDKRYSVQPIKPSPADFPAAGSSQLFPPSSFDPDPRPSSTPLPPHTINAFISRPSSPAIPQSSISPQNITVVTPTAPFPDRLDTPTTNM